MISRAWESNLGYLSGLRRNDGRCVGIRVYSYHGVVERKFDPIVERNFHLISDFRDHVRFLRRYRVLDLPELLDAFATGSLPHGPSAVVTFDDGYRNNTLAAEILAEAGLPWAVFVSTGPIETGGTIWTAELSLLLLHGRADRDRIESLGRIWSLADRDHRVGTFQSIRRALKVADAEDRREAFAIIRDQFPPGETSRLLSRFPSLGMMTWKDVAELDRSGVQIGSHGVEHELHNAAQAEDVRRAELVDSRDELERRLGHPCPFFAYPNGDAHRASIELVSRYYQMAFTTRPGAVVSGDKPHLLPRIDPNGPLRSFARRFHWNPPGP